jgi:hypothetical protein
LTLKINRERPTNTEVQEVPSHMQLVDTTVSLETNGRPLVSPKKEFRSRSTEKFKESKIYGSKSESTPS